tara:strand:- start:181989 stop:183527 length:1539 start_codon:yes stop_codon:yes gene_type:complete
MQLEEFLEQTAARTPDKVALIVGDRQLTYREIETEANQLAHGLIARGVQRGDRVVLFLDNCVEAAVGVWAVLKAGAVFVMANPTTKPDKLTYLLNNSRAVCIIGQSKRLRSCESIWSETPHLRNVVVVGAPEDVADCMHPLTGWSDLVDEHSDNVTPPAKRCIDVDLAALVYTSGSTGNPKGVMLAHANMVAANRSITTYLCNTPGDIVLNVLPLSFDYGLYQWLMCCNFGGTLVLEKSFTYPHAVLERIVNLGVTGFPIVPTIVAILLQMDLKKYDLSKLRYFSNTGAAFPVEHITTLRKLLPDVGIYSMYGLTECKRVSYLPPEEIDRRTDSVGIAMPNCETMILDDDGNELGPNELGELVVRGSNVMKGYWEAPELTAQRLRPGRIPHEMWLSTGDLFRSDEDGFLYWVGRKDDIIKSRGEKVSPREVEDVLHQHPQIAEAAVIGVEDEVLGQAVRAVVRLQSDAEVSVRDVQSHCRSFLEDFMVPQQVEFRDALPRTANGKIDKKVLV